MLQEEGFTEKSLNRRFVDNVLSNIDNDNLYKQCLLKAVKVFKKKIRVLKKVKKVSVEILYLDRNELTEMFGPEIFKSTWNDVLDAEYYFLQDMNKPDIIHYVFIILRNEGQDFDHDSFVMVCHELSHCMEDDLMSEREVWFNSLNFYSQFCPSNLMDKKRFMDIMLTCLQEYNKYYQEVY